MYSHYIMSVKQNYLTSEYRPSMLGKLAFGVEEGVDRRR